MSVQVMAWALEQRIVLDAPARHVLLCLANYADKDGRGAFPAVQRLADDTGLSVRTIQRQLAALVAAGVIRRGSDAIVAAYIPRADRRPVCYDIIMQRSDAVAPGERQRDDNRARHGMTGTTEQGVTVSPNPSDNHQKEIHAPIVPDGNSATSEQLLTNQEKLSSHEELGQQEDQHGQPTPVEVIRETYNRMLGHRPGCTASLATTALLERKLRKADANARKTCKAAGVIFDAPEFWEIYFSVCLQDPWMRGDRPNPNNARWKQSLSTLIDDERFEQVMNIALGSLEIER
ncbi:helix-turn-helix domain-containing protein [Xanthomonas oryzae pv. oryzicola]|uniref:helix-turn-helix domain-containing protein n=1 Tax=Xanthomonas oryzae TaxID=347 RepID=UPI000AC492A5|nr:helix-turn-helix domain-containing protein [Xanthomonas oryzae]